MRSPLFVFLPWQSYGLHRNTKRGFHLSSIHVRPPAATRKENKPGSPTVKPNEGMETIRMIGKEFLFAHVFLRCAERMSMHEAGRCSILLTLCLGSFCTALAYEDKIVEIDGVEYFYHEEQYDNRDPRVIHAERAKRAEQRRTQGSKAVKSAADSDARNKVECIVLGRGAPRRSVNIPDDRKRLCIPKTIKEKQVVKIEEEACRHLVDVEEIVLPEGITEIGRGAFKECWSLKRITIPATVHTINMGYVFKDCESLKSITLPENVRIGGEEMFMNCRSLEKFEFPKDVSGIGDNGRPIAYTQIGSRFFEGCSSLKEIVIPSSVIKIGYGAFAECSALSKVVLPSKLTTVCGRAFQGCRSLETINLPESVLEIHSKAFNGCSGLKSIKLPFRITKIEGGDYQNGGMFGNCKSLTDISIPENVEEIGAWAFLNCSSLQTVSFSTDIQNIRVWNGAFSGCRNLKEIILPRKIADSVLNTNLDNKDGGKRLRELPGLKITYLD